MNAFKLNVSFQYMQRGGSWDNSDVKDAKNKLSWTETDKKYANRASGGGGGGQPNYWTGVTARRGLASNANNSAQQQQVETKKKGGLFGLFP